MEERICPVCNEPLDPDSHGNQQIHPDCAYKRKKERQREKYKIGNEAKLRIQKNEKVLGFLHEMDTEKKGIPYLKAMEYGLKFDCPSIKFESPILFKTINIFDRYGYSIEKIDNKTLIYIYHVSELF